MNAKNNPDTYAGQSGPTSTMTVRETDDYLDKQKSKGWPGSTSIKNRPITRLN